MKGEVTLAILNIAARATLGIEQLFEATVRAGYGASMGKIHREFEKIDERNERVIAKIMTDQRTRIRYSKMINYLLRDGLLEQKRDGGIVLSPRGEKQRAVLLKRKERDFPSAHYTCGTSTHYAIVIFDIPERERVKRTWLRAALHHIGLHMIQRSVWIGKTRIPKKFLEDLRTLRLLDYVEIFAITKAGTLKHILSRGAR